MQIIRSLVRSNTLVFVNNVIRFLIDFCYMVRQPWIASIQIFVGLRTNYIRESGSQSKLNVYTLFS